GRQHGGNDRRSVASAQRALSQHSGHRRRYRRLRHLRWGAAQTPYSRHWIEHRPAVAVACHDIVWISERETVQACRELLTSHGLFVGGSSGTAFAAVKRYAASMQAYEHPTVLFLCADRGTPYLDTVFDPTWAARLE